MVVDNQGAVMNSTCQAVPHHPHSLPCDDMSFQKSLSKFREKVKQKVSKIGDRPEKGGSDVGGETPNPPPLSLQSASPAPSISQSVGSRGVRTLPLTDNVGDQAVPNPPHVEATTSKGELDREYRASSAPEMLLYAVEGVSGAFPLLRSVVAHLCDVLDNFNVRFIFVLGPWCLRFSQPKVVNKQAIELLGYRIKALAESPCTPASEGDSEEKARRNELEQ